MKTLLRYSLLSLIFIIAPVQAKSIMVLGDSLSAAYGMEKTKGWVSLLQQKLKQQNSGYRVNNLSTSGDTTRNGLTKLNHALKKSSPEIIIIQLGSNDALRGLTLSALKKNLSAMIRLSKEKKAKVLLISNRLPPNYGRRFTTRYKQQFKRLGKQHKVFVINEFLKGVAEQPSLMQSDGLHPKQQAQKQLLDNVWPALSPLL